MIFTEDDVKKFEELLHIWKAWQELKREAIELNQSDWSGILAETLLKWMTELEAGK